MNSIIWFLIFISYVSPLQMHENKENSRHLLSSQFDASWTNGGDISSPAKTIYMAAAFHYNNKIFVFGDFTNPKSLFQYDITTEQFTDFGSTALTVNIAGYSQFWTQTGNIAYIIGYYTGNTERNLYIYDLSTNNVPSLTATLTIRNNTSGGKACLASGNNMLFVVGGVDPLCSPPDPTCSINGDLKLLQIYDLLSQRWLSNGPLMRWQRDQFACIVMNDYLYAMGGFSVYDNQQWADGGLIAKIEKIQISNIYNNAWAYTQNELKIKIRKHSAITFGDYIVVIGGQSYDSGSDAYGPVDKVQLINTVSDVVTFAGGTLNKAAYSSAPILIGNVVYAFGGIGASVGIDTWQYLTLPSDSPTSDPTENPSSVPSRNPTKSPTNLPSSTPTMAPTPAPTQDPTPAPSINPTQDPTPPPTNQPTQNPTSDPTDPPTPLPTYSPTPLPTDPPSPLVTYTPTVLPTDETYNPTILPTNNPIQYTTQTPATSTETAITSIATETEITTTNKNEPANDGGKRNTNLLTGLNSSLILIALVFIFVLLFIIFLFLWLRKRKEMQSIMNKSDSIEFSDDDYVQLTDGNDNNNL